MTMQPEKESPKGAEISQIGREANTLEQFLVWLKRYATLLSIAGVLIFIALASNTMLWKSTSTRFDDTAIRIDDTKAEVRRVERRLSSQMDDVNAEVGRVEDRIGKRIDDVSIELRDARQERKTDLNALRQDVQGLRHDVAAQNAQRSTTN